MFIGRGGSAIVYKARDIHNGGIYALKKYITSDPANRKRLLEGMERELEVLKNCTHPVLPKIFDLIKIEDAFFLVMEYIDGIDLKKYVDEYGTLSTKMLVKVMEQVCSGFYYLHSLSPAIVYRDLKPANIILCKDGRIKLIDFGIAKRYRTDIDVDKLALGSKGFAAPEQFGFTRCKKEDIVGGEPAANAQIAREILDGVEGPKMDAVLLNAGAAIYIATDGITTEQGIEKAKEMITSGKAKAKLEQFIEDSNE